MKREIEKIIEVSKGLRITANQSLFLIAYREGIYSVDLPGEELLDLIKKGFLKGNRVTEEALTKVNEALNEAQQVEVQKAKANAQYPILTRETGNLVKVLSKHFHRGDLSQKDFDRLSAYNKNPLAIPFLFMFLEMFPTADKSKNKAWAKHFGKNASEVTLRKLSRGTARKFQEIWKKKDIGLFLLGTYLCVKQSYNQQADCYYVKKIENYLSEWEHWYNMAEDMLEAGDLADYTKPPKVNQSSTNTNVI